MSDRWIHENPAYWDDAKADIVGAVDPGVFDLGERAIGDVVPGEWWRLERDGKVVAYGWMDVNWGDAEILLAVAPGARGKLSLIHISEPTRQPATSRMPSSA